jgi:succinate dehydrogenase / fumarate reductase cytochrome b subunit
MRWSGLIVLAFIVWHLLDLTFGVVNSEVGNMVQYEGDTEKIKAVYVSVIASFDRIPVALFYVVANILLGIHLFHGAWSIFQSLGWNNPRFNKWRRAFATGFAAVIVVGNVSFPVAVMAGVIS